MKKNLQLLIIALVACFSSNAFAQTKVAVYPFECTFYGKKGITEKVRFSVERRAGNFWTGGFSQAVRVAKADGSIVKTSAALKIVGTQDPNRVNFMNAYQAQMTIRNPDVGVVEVYKSEKISSALYFERHLRNDRIRNAAELKVTHAQHQQHLQAEPLETSGIAFFCHPR